MICQIISFMELFSLVNKLAQIRIYLLETGAQKGETVFRLFRGVTNELVQIYRDTCNSKDYPLTDIDYSVSYTLNIMSNPV